jgi:hypothetical protein
MSLSSTDLREPIRFSLLEAILSLFHFLKVIPIACRSFAERIRSAFLKIILSLVYFLLVTPIAWRKRGQRKSEVAAWKHYQARIGWRINEQSTSDSEIYRSLSSSRDHLAALVREWQSDSWMLLLYDVLLRLEFLAKPPKEKELSADLYMMF